MCDGGRELCLGDSWQDRLTEDDGAQRRERDVGYLTLLTEQKDKVLGESDTILRVIVNKRRNLEKRRHKLLSYGESGSDGPAVLSAEQIRARDQLPAVEGEVAFLHQLEAEVKAANDRQRRGWAELEERLGVIREIDVAMALARFVQFQNMSNLLRVSQRSAGRDWLPCNDLQDLHRLFKIVDSCLFPPSLDAAEIYAEDIGLKMNDNKFAAASQALAKVFLQQTAVFDEMHDGSGQWQRHFITYSDVSNILERLENTLRKTNIRAWLYSARAEAVENLQKARGTKRDQGTMTASTELWFPTLAQIEVYRQEGELALAKSIGNPMLRRAVLMRKFKMKQDMLDVRSNSPLVPAWTMPEDGINGRCTAVEATRRNIRTPLKPRSSTKTRPRPQRNCANKIAGRNRNALPPRFRKQKERRNPEHAPSNARPSILGKTYYRRDQISQTPDTSGMQRISYQNVLEPVTQTSKSGRNNVSTPILIDTSAAVQKPQDRDSLSPFSQLYNEYSASTPNFGFSPLIYSQRKNEDKRLKQTRRGRRLGNTLVLYGMEQVTTDDLPHEFSSSEPWLLLNSSNDKQNSNTDTWPHDAFQQLQKEKNKEYSFRPNAMAPPVDAISLPTGKSKLTTLMPSKTIGDQQNEQLIPSKDSSHLTSCIRKRTRSADSRIYKDCGIEQWTMGSGTTGIIWMPETKTKSMLEANLDIKNHVPVSSAHTNNSAIARCFSSSFL